MTLRMTIVSLTGLMLSIAAVAGEQHRRVEIVVDDESGEPITFDSEIAGFDPMELQLGESQSVIDENGNVLFIVRTEEGIEIETNGRRVAIPDPDAVVEAHIMEIGADEHEGARRVVIERTHELEHDIHVQHETGTDQDEVREIRVVREVVNDTN